MADDADIDSILEEVDRVVTISDAARGVRLFVGDVLDAGAQRTVTLELAKMYVLDTEDRPGWAFFEHAEELRSLVRGRFQLGGPGADAAYQLLRRVRKRIERLYVYGLFYGVPGLVVTAGALLIMGVPVLAITVVLAVAGTTMTAAGMFIQMTNRRTKELDELINDLKLPPATTP